jgi:hypothetical protein
MFMDRFYKGRYCICTVGCPSTPIDRVFKRIPLTNSHSRPILRRMMLRDVGVNVYLPKAIFKSSIDTRNIKKLIIEVI